MASLPPSEHVPNQATLDALFGEAHRIKILNQRPIGFLGRCGEDARRDDHEDFIIEIEGAEIAAVRDLLRIRDRHGQVPCRCIGEVRIELHGAAGNLATISLHHGRAIRLARWRSDAVLLDGAAFLRWMADRGAPGQLHAYERQQAEIEHWNSAYRAWIDAAPACVAPLLLGGDGSHSSADASPDRVMAALVAAYPSVEERALALLAWYAHSSMTWWTIGGYELFPGQLLERIGSAAVLRALEQREPVAEAVLLGAARYFSVMVDRKSELTAVPDALWERLLEVTRRAGVEENVAGLERAVESARFQRARPTAPVRMPDATVIAGVTNEGHQLYHLAAGGRRLYTIDRGMLVRFDRGSATPAPLCAVGPEYDISADAEGACFTAPDTTDRRMSRIMRVDASGAGAPFVVASRQWRPRHLVIAGGHAFWAVEREIPGTSTGRRDLGRDSMQVMKAPLSGGAPAVPVALTAYVAAMLGDDVHLYWVEDAWTSGRPPEPVLARVPLSGGAREVLATVPIDLPYAPGRKALALSASHVLWIDPAMRRIRGVPKEGGEVITVCDLELPPRAIVADGRFAYVIVGEEQGDPVSRGGVARELSPWHVERIALDDARSTRLASFQNSPFNHLTMAMDDAGIYWTCEDRILMVPRPEAAA